MSLFLLCANMTKKLQKEVSSMANDKFPIATVEDKLMPPKYVYYLG